MEEKKLEGPALALTGLCTAMATLGFGKQNEVLRPHEASVTTLLCTSLHPDIDPVS